MRAHVPSSHGNAARQAQQSPGLGHSLPAQSAFFPRSAAAVFARALGGRAGSGTSGGGSEASEIAAACEERRRDLLRLIQQHRHGSVGPETLDSSFSAHTASMVISEAAQAPADGGSSSGSDAESELAIVKRAPSSAPVRVRSAECVGPQGAGTFSFWRVFWTLGRASQPPAK